MVKNIVISTPSGQLQGLFLKSSEGDDYYSFKGIPYAKPPIGDLRFQDPKPFGSWKDIRDATQHGPISLQYDMGAKDVVGSEDCLYLNIYTRSIEKNARLPVLFWVHGGAFLIGSGNSEEFGPDYFVRKDVVLVTINYRLGIFGFLNLDCKLATGNQGLKDQLMALHWVKSHIAYFGGDSDNVTIFGGSAGGACVNLLAVSPLANGLFHKAICQSGCALNPWAIKKEPKKSLNKFLEAVGKQEEDPEKIFEFLKTENCRKLIETQHKITTYREWFRLDFPFCPTLDDKSSIPFMPMDPTTTEHGTIHVPFMLGYNSLEGLILIPFLQFVSIEEIDQNMENYISYDLQRFLNNHKLSLKELRKLYLEDEKISESNLFKFLHLACDISFSEGLHRLAKMQASNSSASSYFYKLSFDRNTTPFKMVNNITMKGVGHGDELLYLFKMQVHDTLNIKQLQNDIAEKVNKQMIELWVNFAKTGRPTPKVSELIPSYWQPLNSDTVLRYFDISDELHMKKMLNLDDQYSFK